MVRKYISLGSGFYYSGIEGSPNSSQWKSVSMGKSAVEVLTNETIQVVGSINSEQANAMIGAYWFTPNDSPLISYIGIPKALISDEAQIILNKFDNGDYTITQGTNSGIDLVRNGTITSELFVSTFNNLLSSKLIIDKTIITTPVVTPPIVTPPVVTPPIVTPPVVIPPIQLSTDNFLPNGNVRVIRVTGTPANDYEVTDGVALANLQSYLDSGVFRLLTQAELDYVAPPVIVPPVIVPKEYDVTVLRINEFGGVYSELFYGIKGNKLKELESQFLVVLSDKPKPSDQEVRDYYNFVDTNINENMVSQSIGAFTLKEGKVTGKIIYIAESAFNSYYYNKPVTSVVQIKDQAGSTIKLKTNNLNFTETQRDETITINEGVGNNVKAVKIEFYVWKGINEPVAFALKKIDEIVDSTVFPDPCPIGQHRNFNNKCVPDDQTIGGKPSVIGLLGGVTALLGTLALLGSKGR